MHHSTIISVLTTLLFLPVFATAAPYGDLPSGGEPAVNTDGSPITRPANMPILTGPVTFTQTVQGRSSEVLSTMDIASATMDAEKYISILAQISSNSLASVESEKNKPSKRAAEYPEPTLTGESSLDFDPNDLIDTRTDEPTTITRSIVMPSTTILWPMDIDYASFNPSEKASLLSEIDAAKAHPTDAPPVKRDTAQPALTTQSYWVNGRLVTHTIAAAAATGPPRQAVKREPAPALTTQSYWINGRLTTQTIAAAAATGPPRQAVKREPAPAVDELDRRSEAAPTGRPDFDQENEPPIAIDNVKRAGSSSEDDLINRLPDPEHEPMATTSGNPAPTLY